MYMEADDFGCGTGMRTNTTSCAGINEKSSGAEAYSVGLFYTLPAGPELRMVYGKVDNDRYSSNGFGITTSVSGWASDFGDGKEKSFQLGVVQWF